MAEHRGSVLHVPQNEEMGKGRQTKARSKWTRLHARDNRLIKAFRRIFIRGTRRNERGRGGRVSSVWETNGHWANFMYCVRGMSVVVSIHEWVFSFSIAGRGPFPRQNNNLFEWHRFYKNLMGDERRFRQTDYNVHNKEVPPPADTLLDATIFFVRKRPVPIA